MKTEGNHMVIPSHFKLSTAPLANEGAVVRCGPARFTVLTTRLLRLEHQAAGNFLDQASITAQGRPRRGPM